MVTKNKHTARASLKLNIPQNAHLVVKYLAERKILATESWPPDDSTTLTLFIPKEFQVEFKALAEEHKLKREPGTVEKVDLWFINSVQNPKFVEDYRSYVLIPLLEMRDREDAFRTTFGGITLRECLEKIS